MPRRQVSRETRSLRSIVDHPALPALVQSLAPRELAQLCGRIGTADAMLIMALAPVGRLVQALEASVWKTPRPGVPGRFDSHELIEWLEAWLEIGPAFAAERLAAVSDDYLTLYLSQLTAVTTGEMWGFERSTEIGDLDRVYAPSHDEKAYGPYVASARRAEEWETVRGALDALWTDAPERLLHLFSLLSGDESVLAPQRNRESSNDDIASERERAGERRGYVTASGARAFLALSRSPLAELATMSEYDPETRRLLDRSDGDPGKHSDSGDPHAKDGRAEPMLSSHEEEVRLAALQVVLEEAGLLEAPARRLLLSHERATRHLPIETLLQALAQNDMAEFDLRARELAYLSSVLIAGVPVGGAALTPADAQRAALATCNLGLETLSSAGERVRIDCEPGLVRLFLVGRSVLSPLPESVVQAFAQRVERLKTAGSEPLHEWLLEQAEVAVEDLRAAVGKSDFEAAREATMALCFVFEPRACQAVMPLLDEVPRIGTVDPATATWIDSLAGLARAVDLLRSLSGKRRRGASPRPRAGR